MTVYLPNRKAVWLPFYPDADIIVVQCRSCLLAVERCFVGKCFRMAPRYRIGSHCGAAVSNGMGLLHDLLDANNLRISETVGQGCPDDLLPKKYRRGHTRD